MALFDKKKSSKTEVINSPSGVFKKHSEVPIPAKGKITVYTIEGYTMRGKPIKFNKFDTGLFQRIKENRVGYKKMQQMKKDTEFVEMYNRLVVNK